MRFPREKKQRERRCQGPRTQTLGGPNIINLGEGSKEKLNEEPQTDSLRLMGEIILNQETMGNMAHDYLPVQPFHAGHFTCLHTTLLFSWSWK